MCNEKQSNKPIDVEAGLALIERLESDWYRSSWKAEACVGRLAKLDDLNSLEKSPVFCRASVICEPVTGRIRADVEAAIRWVHGVDSHLAVTAAYGFGADYDRWWE